MSAALEIDDTPARAIEVIACELGRWRHVTGRDRVEARALHAALAGHGLQVVDAGEIAKATREAEQRGRKLTAIAAAEGYEAMYARATAAESRLAELATQAPSCSTCGGILANRVCLACYEAELDRARAAIVHSAQVLDREHAALASQLALAMAWGAELLEQLQHEREARMLHPDGKCRCAGEGTCVWCREFCGTCGGDGGFNDVATCTACGGTGLAVDELRVARKAVLDAQLETELQRAEYGRLLEAERARSRKLELELDKVREG